MPGRGQIIFLLALALLTIGVVMVNSAGIAIEPVGLDAAPDEAIAADPVTLEAILTSRSAMYAAVAIGAMLVAAFLPVSTLARRLTPRPEPKNPLESPQEAIGRARDTARAGLVFGTAVLLFLLLTVYVPGLERERNGAHRWIDLRLPGLESVQPSEFAKWGLPVLMAWYATGMGAAGLSRFFTGLLPALVATGLVAGVIILEDLGTGVLVGASASIVLIAAGARVWQFALFIPPALVGVAVAVWTSPYRVQRILSFLDPYADPAGSGYHMIQSMATVSGGGLTGRGLGHGLQKFGYLPEDTTDFLFAIICEELGLAGAALVLALYAMLILTLTGAARLVRQPVCKLFILGVAATIGLQAVMNLVVVTGLGPTKGIALPLLSAGGTGWVLTAMSLGLVIAAGRDRAVQSAIEEFRTPPASGAEAYLASEFDDDDGAHEDGDEAYEDDEAADYEDAEDGEEVEDAEEDEVWEEIGEDDADIDDEEEEEPADDEADEDEGSDEWEEEDEAWDEEDEAEGDGEYEEDGEYADEAEADEYENAVEDETDEDEQDDEPASLFDDIDTKR